MCLKTKLFQLYGRQCMCDRPIWTDNISWQIYWSGSIDYFVMTILYILFLTGNILTLLILSYHILWYHDGFFFLHQKVLNTSSFTNVFYCEKLYISNQKKILHLLHNIKEISSLFTKLQLSLLSSLLLSSKCGETG